MYICNIKQQIHYYDQNKNKPFVFVCLSVSVCIYVLYVCAIPTIITSDLDQLYSTTSVLTSHLTYIRNDKRPKACASITKQKPVHTWPSPSSTPFRLLRTC